MEICGVPVNSFSGEAANIGNSPVNLTSTSWVRKSTDIAMSESFADGFAFQT